METAKEDTNANHVADTIANYDEAGTLDQQDGAILDPQETALQNAIAQFDAKAVKKLIEEGLDIKTTWLDTRKYRNALHELAVVYMSYSPFGKRHLINNLL